MTQVSPDVLGPTLSWALRVGGGVIVLGTAVCLGILILMRYRSVHIERWALRTVGFLEAHHLNRVELMIGAFLNGFRSVQSAGATIRMVLYTVLESGLGLGLLLCLCNQEAFGTDVSAFASTSFGSDGFCHITGSLVQLCRPSVAACR